MDLLITYLKTRVLEYFGDFKDYLHYKFYIYDKKCIISQNLFCLALLYFAKFAIESQIGLSLSNHCREVFCTWDVQIAITRVEQVTEMSK